MGYSTVIKNVCALRRSSFIPQVRIKQPGCAGLSTSGYRWERNEAPPPKGSHRLANREVGYKRVQTSQMISDGGDCSEDNRKVKKKKSNHVEGGRRSVTGSWRVTPRLKAEDDGRWWAAGRSGRDAGSSHRLTGQGQGEAGGRAFVKPNTRFCAPGII